MTAQRCRQCQRPIKWGVYRKRWTPLDVEPHPDGRWVRQGRHHRRLVGVKLEMAQYRRTPLLKPHTCLTEEERDHHDR